VGRPGNLPLTLRIGDTEEVIAEIQDENGAAVNIAARTYAAQVRAKPDSSSTLAAFVCTVTSGGGGIVTCTLSSGTTAALSPGAGVWDMQETVSGVVETLLAGPVMIVRDVTR
jgi:hypothetical protein